MGMFILRRTGVMLLTAICLTFIVFIMTNLYPNLEKLAKNEGNFRMSDAEVASYLGNRGYTQGKLQNYGEWLGILPGYVIKGIDGKTRGRCSNHGAVLENSAKYCGVIQGHWGFSSRFKEPVSQIVITRLFIVKTPVFPRIHSAATTAPSPKPSLLCAVCVNEIRSTSEL